jgi:hypothetical protein
LLKNANLIGDFGLENPVLGTKKSLQGLRKSPQDLKSELKLRHVEEYYQFISGKKTRLWI